MFVKYEAFNDVPDETQIWRYMDFTSFLFLIEETVLHFSRLDKLEDRFEGSLGIINIQARQEALEKVPKEIQEHFLKSSIRNNAEGRKYIFVNCWSVNKHESAALWKLFIKGNGVAIRSSIKGLKAAIENDKNNAVLLSKIRYIDHSREGVSFETAITPYAFKRKSFEYEQEIRAIIVKHPSKTKDGDPIAYDPFNKNESAPGAYTLNPELNLYEDGLDVPVDLSKLVEKIFISPNSPNWFFKLVEKIIKNKKLDFEIEKSSLDDSALY